MPKPTLPASERFWAKVTEDGDCWIWTACIDKTTGYGRFQLDGKATYAHRFAYEDLRTEIPTGLHIDHLCRNRACVNPWHLEPVTPRVNALRGPATIVSTNVAKSHCPEGHPYAGENLRLHVDKRGLSHRICIACNIARCRAYRAAQRAS